MAKAKKLPSGSWRCLAYAGKDKSGKRQYKSFTAPTKKEAELLAAQYVMEKELYSDENNLMLKTAMQRYNEAKSGVLSPATLRGYNSYKDFTLKDKWDIPIKKIDSEMMQTWISEWSENHKPKTVKNIHGYVQGVLNFFDCGQNLKVTLPQKVPYNYHVVTDEELKALLKHTDGTELGIAIALAAFIPARRSEICALTNADVDRKNNTVTINKAMVENDSKEWIIKTIPKTYKSNRTVELPESIIKKIPEKPGRIIEAIPSQIENRFSRALRTLKLDFRFHDLRHYGATFLHAQGIPEKMIMDRGGWESAETLQKIYTHTLPETKKAATDAVTAKFTSLTK